MPFLIIAAAFGILFFTREAFASGVNMDSLGYKQYKENWGKYDSLFRDASLRYGVPFKYLKGIAMIESSLGLDPRVKSGGVSSDGKSWGLMQFTLPTAQDFDSGATPQKLNNDVYSVDLAGQFLKSLMKQFPNDERKVIMSYNQGAGNTRAGKQYAAAYYTKFVNAVTLIES